MALVMLLCFISLIALPSIFWLYALADVTVNSFKEFTSKIIWILILCIAPPLGTVFYFFIGRGQRTTHYPVAGVLLMAILIIPLVMIVCYFFYSLGQISFVPEPPNSMQIQI